MQVAPAVEDATEGIGSLALSFPENAGGNEAFDGTNLPEITQPSTRIGGHCRVVLVLCLGQLCRLD